MTGPDDFLQQAAEADAAADAAADPVVENQFRKLAEHWRVMAKLAMALPVYGIDTEPTDEGA